MTKRRDMNVDLPHLVPPSASPHAPVSGGTEIWEADFIDMDKRPEVGIDRRRWPPQEKRDLVLELPVLQGQIPNEVVWKYAQAHLGRPFQGNLRRIR